VPADGFLETECVMPTIDEFKALSAPASMQAAAASLPLPFAYDGWKCLKPENFSYQTAANFYVPGPLGDPVRNGGGYPRGRPYVLMRERFLWTIQYFVAQGFYVALDYHPYYLESDWQLITEDSTVGLPKLFATKWTDLLKSLKALPVWADHLRGRVMIDLANEMDIMNCKWDVQGVPREHGMPPCPPFRDLLNAAIDKLSEEEPGIIIWANGVSQIADKCSSRGDGFRVDEGTKGTSALSWFQTVNKTAAVALSVHQRCESNWWCSEDQMFQRCGCCGALLPHFRSVAPL
jgi:hypothetical protein